MAKVSEYIPHNICGLQLWEVKRLVLLWVHMLFGMPTMIRAPHFLILQDLEDGLSLI